MTGSNLLAQDPVEVLGYFDDRQRLDQTTTRDAFRTVRALLEMQF